jgi:putative transposase
MPSRLKRYQTEGHYRFITFSCYRRLPYLNNGHSRIVFERTLETLRRRHCFFLFGYVLMPEHVHLLLAESKLHSLATTLSVLKGQTSKLLKREQPQFWQSRYYDFNIFTQQKFVEKLRYIHRNPVERGLVGKPEGYWNFTATHQRWGTHSNRQRNDGPQAALGIVALSLGLLYD